MNRLAPDIVTLRVAHCRAEHAANGEQYHLAVMHYRTCLEAAERREDCQAVRFFALRLADCYSSMGLAHKAREFRSLSACADDGADGSADDGENGRAGGGEGGHPLLS